MTFTKTDPMRRDCMNWNSIYMTPKGYPAPPAFSAPRNSNKYSKPTNVKEAEKMQLEEALEQVKMLIQVALCGRQ